MKIKLIYLDLESEEIENSKLLAVKLDVNGRPVEISIRENKMVIRAINGVLSIKPEAANSIVIGTGGF